MPSSNVPVSFNTATSRFWGKCPKTPAAADPGPNDLLTRDAAKPVGMMSGTDKDLEVRDYSIEVDKKWVPPGQPRRSMPRLGLRMMSRTRPVQELRG